MSMCVCANPSVCIIHTKQCNQNTWESCVLIKNEIKSHVYVLANASKVAENNIVQYYYSQTPQKHRKRGKSSNSGIFNLVVYSVSERLRFVNGLTVLISFIFQVLLRDTKQSTLHSSDSRKKRLLK